MQTGSYSSGSVTGLRMITGLESGYGSRAIDRDLSAGDSLVAPAASSDVSLLSHAEHASLSNSREISRPPSVIPSPTNLKDSDGDDIMSPPPHDAQEADVAPILSEPIVLVEEIEPNPDVEMTVKVDFAPIVAPPESAGEGSWTDIVFEGGSVDSALKELEGEEVLKEVARRKGKHTSSQKVTQSTLL